MTNGGNEYDGSVIFPRGGNSLLSGNYLVGNNIFSTEKSIFILGYRRNHGESKLCIRGL